MRKRSQANDWSNYGYVLNLTVILHSLVSFILIFQLTSVLKNSVKQYDNTKLVLHTIRVLRPFRDYPADLQTYGNKSVDMDTVPILFRYVCGVDLPKVAGSFLLTTY